MPIKNDVRYKTIGCRKRASSRYAMLCYRCNNTHQPKNACYKNIEVRISRDDFIAWFMVNDFDGCSVDRIDSTKHYEVGNLQLISLAENIAKDKLKFCDGIGVCYSCKESKPIDEFVSDKRRQFIGKTTICKTCYKLLYHNKYKKKKESLND